MLTMLLTIAALADPGQALATCCAEAGASCPDSVEIIGMSSVREGTGTVGVWRLTCDQGAAYLAHARRDARGRPGEVITTLSPAAAPCFDQTCRLPEDLCIAHEGGRTVVRDCKTSDLAFDDHFMRPLEAAPDVVPEPAPAGRVVVRDTSVTPPDHRTASTVLPPFASPTASHGTDDAPRSRPAAPPPPPSGGVDWSLPDLPASPCVADHTLREPALGQVGLGDEAMVAGDPGRALGHYRTSVQLNPCNAFGWASLGKMFLDSNYPSRARDAFEAATRLAPRNYRAWADLGLAYESLDQTADALRAYQEALTLRPGYLPAEDGLRRTARAR